MEYEPPQIRMGVKRPLQHPGYLRHVGVERKIVRDDFAREHVLDRAEVAFAPREVELADVGRPLLVRPRAGEIAFVVRGAVLSNAFDQKELRGFPGPAFVGAIMPFRHSWSQPHLPHQAVHFGVADFRSASPKRRRHPPHAVPPFGRFEHRGYFGHQIGVFGVLVRVLEAIEIG